VGCIHVSSGISDVGKINGSYWHLGFYGPKYFYFMYTCAVRLILLFSTPTSATILQNTNFMHPLS
jgi:hypothetical protein